MAVTCPGSTPASRQWSRRVADEGHSTVGIRRGWAGLLECNPDDPASVATCIMPLDPGTVRTIDRSGGTVLHSSRTNPARVKAGGGAAAPRTTRSTATARSTSPRTALTVLERLGIDALVPIGGDDTLSFALRLSDEGVPGRGHPQDDGQRRARHRLLHRLLHGRHPHGELHPPAAHERRLARAPRGGRGVRALQRGDVAHLGLPVRRRPGRSSPRCRSTSIGWPSC